jgi:hypothetical protein
MPLVRIKLHIYILWAFAVSQPLLDIVSGNAELLVARHINAGDIAILLVVLCLVAPTILLLPGLLIAYFSRRTSAIYFLLLAGLLVSLTAQQLLKKTLGPHGPFLVPCALILGAAFTVLYYRYAPVRSFCSYLSPAILVFPLVFLFNPDVSRVVTVTDSFAVHPANSARDIPIVMVVFDEMPILSLLGEQANIDSIRYPNFAALAADSHWFRNARSPSGITTVAVPALLSGHMVKNVIPVTANYPRNLFTLFSATHELFVDEEVTALCPPVLCSPRVSGTTGATRQKMEGFFGDLGVIYLHLLAPEEWRGRLPAISQSWSNFAAQGAAAIPDVDVAHTPQPELKQGQKFERFIDSIAAGDKPRLYFHHALLPHVPWEYLPSGKLYSVGGSTVPGLDLVTELWGENKSLVEQGYQRHLLQVGFVDKLLGQLIAKLEAEGLYDKALLVIASDHGVGFWPGKSRRARGTSAERELATRGTVLFVKIPFQHQGQIHDALVSTLDVLPTIESVLGYQDEYDYQGHDLLITSAHEENDLPNPYLNYVQLQRKLDLFGSGNQPGAYSGDGFGHLLGKRKEDISLDSAGELQIELDWSAALEDFNPDNSYILARLTGQVTGASDPHAQLALAVALNGPIVAVTHSYDQAGEMRFSVMLPESGFIKGANTVELFRVLDDVDSGVRLEPIPSAARPVYRYTAEGNLTGGDGEILLQAGPVQGYIDAVRRVGKSLLIGGWVVDRGNSRPADFVLLDIDGQLSYIGEPGLPRPDVAEYFQTPALVLSGFEFRFRAHTFDATNTPTVKLIGVSGNKASVLDVEFNVGEEIDRLRGRPIGDQPMPPVNLDHP